MRLGPKKDQKYIWDRDLDEKFVSPNITKVTLGQIAQVKKGKWDREQINRSRAQVGVMSELLHFIFISQHKASTETEKHFLVSNNINFCISMK